MDFIQADFSLTPYALYIHNCNILYLPATVQFAGIISPNQNFLESVISEASDLKIVKDTQEFDIEKELKNLNKDSQNISILSMFKAKKPNIYFAGKLKGNNFSTKHLSERLKIKNTDIKAIANCNMYIGGVYIDNKIKDLSGEGDITIDNLMAYENIFNNLTSKVNVNDNIITLSDLKGDAVSYNATDTNRFGTIDGECTYNITTGEILGDLNINNLNINDFRKYYKNYLNAFGITNTKCHFYGTVNKEINDINCNIDTEIPILSVNGKSYRDISLTASLLHSDLFSANGIIKKDDQYLNILVDNLSIKNENVENISVTVQKASVNDLREIFYLSPLAKTKSMKEFLSYLPIISNGTIDLNMTASGNLNSLNGECEINGEDINADFDKLSVFYAKLTAEEGVVNLENLDIEGTEFVLACDAYPLLDIHNAFKPKSETKLAKASLVNNSNINISITNLPLERFGKYINMEDVKGMLACDALITGDLSQPNITASVNVDEPAIGSIQMDNLIASKIDITKDTIDLTEGITLYMTEDNYATLKGTIPMSFINTNNSKDNINLSLEAPEQDLGFLEVLTPLIDKDTSKGTFALTATLAGPISDTTLSGGATISEGEIHTIGHTTLTNINSQITFDNDDAGNLLLNIDKLTLNDNNNKEYAFVADPGYIKIKSKNNILSERINNQNRQQNKNITIGDMLSDGEIYLHGTFDDFYYTNSDFSSFSDKTNCYVNGKIFVEGNLLTPKIYSPETCVLNKVKFSCKAGKNEKSEDDSLLTLANNKIQTTGIYTYNDAVVYDEIFTQLRERRNKKYLFNPSFDISVKAENIEARPPATIAKVDLDATVTGNLNNPTVKGRAVIKEGRSSFQIARARIVKGSSVDFEYSDHTPKADINIEAFSFVHASDKSGNDERYKINIAVKGGLDDYEIKMESDPEGLSQQEILEAFTGINKNTINAGDTLAKIGANNILTPIEDFFVEYLGFDSLGFEYQQNKYAIINIERSFNKKFYASFYSNLYNGENTEKSNISEWELKFGYKFNNRLRMNIGTTDTKERTITFTYGFKF